MSIEKNNSKKIVVVKRTTKGYCNSIKCRSLVHNRTTFQHPMNHSTLSFCSPKTSFDVIFTHSLMECTPTGFLMMTAFDWWWSFSVMEKGLYSWLHYNTRAIIVIRHLHCTQAENCEGFYLHNDKRASILINCQHYYYRDINIHSLTSAILMSANNWECQNWFFAIKFERVREKGTLYLKRPLTVTTIIMF